MNETPRGGANQSKYPAQGASISGHGAGRWLRGDLKAYVDGELPGWRQRLMAWHVARCVSCRDEAAWLEQMSGQFADWENDHSPLPRPELRTRILACLPADPSLLLTPTSVVPKVKMSRRAPRYAFRPTLALGSMAAIALLMVGAFTLNLRQHTNMPANVIARDIVEVVPPQRKVLMVFTAPPESFTADNSGMKATAVGIAPPSGSNQNADGQAEEPGTSVAVNAADNSGVGASSASGTAREALPSEEEYTDPTSREAERLASLAIGKMLNERRQQSAAAKHEIHAPQRAATATAVKITSPQMALAVANVAEARQQIQQWADTTGAKLRVMSEKSNLPALTANNAASTSGTLLELRVPALYAHDFQAHISRLGTPLESSDTSQKRLRPMPMLGTAEAAEPGSFQSPPTPGSTNAIGNASAFVTLRIRLLPGETPPRQ